MSLILEALKKSEQQRRLGEAPTLGSPVLNSRRSRSMLPVLVGLMALALGVGWWLLRTPNAPAPAAMSMSAATVPNPALAHPARRSAAGLASESTAKRNAARRAEQAQRANTKEIALDQQGDKRQGGMPDRPGSVNGAPIANRMTAPLQPLPNAGVPQPAAQFAPAAQHPATAVTKSNPATGPATAIAAQPSAPAAGAQPAGAALPSIWDLPYATRKELPDLQLTLHVYAPDPKQRFVVIKGERHVEGDDLGDGVTLHAIRVDGIVLDFKGKRFFYPRDGR